MVLFPQLRQEDGGQAVRVAGGRPGGGGQAGEPLQEALGRAHGAQAHVLLRCARTMERKQANVRNHYCLQMQLLETDKDDCTRKNTYTR